MDTPWRDEERLRRLYTDGELSMEKIGDRLGCDYRTVYRWMERFGIEKRTAYQDQEGKYRDENVLRELYWEREQSALEIADRFDVSKATIYRWLDRHDIRTRDSTHDIDRGWRDADRIHELYVEKELTDDEIADLMDTKEGTITKWRNRHGIETRDYSGDSHHMWRGGHDGYRGPNWQEKRSKTLRRDQYRCQDCRKTAAQMNEGPDVHHITPFSEFESYEMANSLSNLATLCRPCHIIREHEIGTIHG